jgi:hypothetical protein
MRGSVRPSVILISSAKKYSIKDFIQSRHPDEPRRLAAPGGLVRGLSFVAPI